MDDVQSIPETAPAAPEEPISQPVYQHSEGSWLLAGAVLSCFDASFYLQAGRRKARHAIYFILLFGAVVGTLSALGSFIKTFAVQDRIRAAYDNGTIPAITIRSGIATVEGSMPMVILDQSRTAVIIDTSGKITRLDTSRYDSGILLTREYLQVVNRDGRSQVLQLSDLNRLLDADPLVIDSDSVSRAWAQFSVIFGILYWVGAVAWDAIARLAYLALLALVGWGILKLFRPSAGYAPVFIVGAYAFAPAQYLSYLLSLINVDFFLLQTIVWAAIWTGALWAAVRKSRLQDGGGGAPFWTWKAWLILALVALIGANVVFAWEFGYTLLWAAMAVVLLAIVVGGLVKTLKTKEENLPRPS